METLCLQESFQGDLTEERNPTLKVGGTNLVGRGPGLSPGVHLCLLVDCECQQLLYTSVSMPSPMVEDCTHKQ